MPQCQTSNSSLEVGLAATRMLWAGHDQDSHAVDCLKLLWTQSLWLMTYLYFSPGEAGANHKHSSRNKLEVPAVVWWGLGELTGFSGCLAGSVVTRWAASHCRDISAVADTAPLTSPLVPGCPTSTGGRGPCPPTRQVAQLSKLEHLSHPELFPGVLEVFTTRRWWGTMSFHHISISLTYPNEPFSSSSSSLRKADL